jgi:ketosteroid isomerase-like protein
VFETTLSAACTLPLPRDTARAMSQENVEIVRAAIDAWNRGEWDAAFKDVAPDIEFDNTRDLGEWRGVHTTPGEVKRTWEGFTELWESVSFEVEQVIDAGDQVVSRQSVTLTGRDGIEVMVHGTLLWRLRDGAITHVVSYRELEDALEAAGLSE